MSRRIQIGFKLGGIGEQRSWQYCPDRSLTQYLPVFYVATAHLKEIKVLLSSHQLPGEKFPCIWGWAQQEYVLNHNTLMRALKISELQWETRSVWQIGSCFTSQASFISASPHCLQWSSSRFAFVQTFSLSEAALGPVGMTAAAHPPRRSCSCSGSWCGRDFKRA